MKSIKKFASLLLVLAMVFAMSVPAFAVGEGSITIDNPAEGATYTAYKIFDVVYNDGKTAYSYTINGGSEWFATVNAYAETPESGLTLTPAANDPATYVVKTTTGFSAPSFAAYLKDAVSGKTGAATLNTQNSTANGLALGYYLVVGTKDSETLALANLTTTDPSVTIHDKNDVPFEKVDDQESVDVGQTVNYTITGKVPDTTGFDSYTYKITDKMTKGLTPALTVDENGNVTSGVQINVGTETKTSDWTITAIYGLYSADGKPTTTDSSGNPVTKATEGATVVGFTAEINMAPNGVAKYIVGQPIEVSYSAAVNENAVAKIERNHAELEYSNDPTDSSETTTTPPDEETVYSAKIVIDKYDAAKESTKLSGAEFVLYKTEEGVNKYYKYTAATGSDEAKVEWVEDISNATRKITDSNGAASFDGLKDGTYYLLETEAPEGYNLLTAPVAVTVNGANATEANLSTLTQTAQIANNTGTLLPSTGGMGTTIFYILGGALVLGAAILLIARRRMRTEK